jgi:hypothetical protein
VTLLHLSHFCDTAGTVTHVVAIDSQTRYIRGSGDSAMDTGWVEMVAGVAEIIGEIIIPIFIDRDPSLTPEPKIHPALRRLCRALDSGWEEGCDEQ